MIFKKNKLILILFALTLIIGVAIFATSFSTVLAEVATGSDTNLNTQIYWVTTGIDGENKIRYSKEQYDKYGGYTDWGRTDTLFVVIYEKNC